MEEPVPGHAPASPATVVVTQPVRAGHEAEFQRWQQGMNQLCAEFEGFQGAELVRPVPGVQDDFVILFRFDSMEHLDAWLESDARKQALERGAPFFEGPASQHVLAEETDQPRYASLLVSSRVRAGCEKAYRAWQREVDAAAARFPGFHGNEVFPPVPGRQEEWVVVVRFDSREHLDAWMQSDVRARLLEKAQPFFEHVRVHTIGSGFPGWFHLDRPDGDGFPPSWKQAMTVLLALYPTVMLLHALLQPALADIPFGAQMFVGNAVSVAVLTWLVMPLVNRAFAFWLRPPGTCPAGRQALGLAAMVLGYAAALALFMGAP